MSAITLNPESLKTWQEEDLERLRYEYQLSESDTIVDVGAFKGEWSERIFKQQRCNVIVIEPTEYILFFRFGRIINKAAATHNGKITFGGMSYYTSAFEPGTHEYECIDINSVLECLSEVAVMKINIEGAEYDLLSHIIAHGHHKKIRNFQIQFHQIANRPYQRWYDEIAAQLKQTHEITWRYPFCWENWELK